MKRSRLIAITAAASFLLIVSGPAGAFDPADLQRLLSSKYCPGCDLNIAPLAGANLNGANLSGAMWTDGRRCAAGSRGKCE